MKGRRRAVCWLAACAIAIVAEAQVQNSLSVPYQKHVQIAVSGATAAYSLDSNVADAAAGNGLVDVVGKGSGTANVIVVTPAGVQTLAVTVVMPPPVLPPGFETPENRLNGETGSYEFRYTSDPGQIVNALDMRRNQGDSFNRLQVVNANLFTASSNTSRIGFPYLSYEISHPGRDLTFVDQTVANSPLTVDGFIVRGFHWKEGPWTFHGGFTSIATFQGLFLTTDREELAGISRVFKLDGANSLELNGYYFHNPRSQITAHDGGVGSLVHQFKKGDRISVLSELGFSHGLGFAAKGSYQDEKNHVIGHFKTQAQNFASLAVNSQRGTFADMSASRNFSKRFYATYDLSESSFRLPTLRQNTFTNSAQVNFKIDRNFSVNGGGAFSRFQSLLPAGPTIETLNLPAGIDFWTRHFGSGFQYQRTINFDATGGNDYAANVRASVRQFQLSAFFRHDVQVPTLQAVFAQFPGLEDLLQRLGIVASTPEQLANLLQNSALLQLLGFSGPLTVNLAPARNDFNAAVTWMSAAQSRRRKIDASYFRSTTELIGGGRFVLATASLSYSERLSRNNDIVGSASLARTTNGGITQNKPLFSIGLQHRFYSVPSLLLPGRHGVIQGHVFTDNDSTGRYDNSEPTLGGIEVQLDENRVTHTNAQGYYSFHHVPFGVHRVEAKYASDQPFFYTTDSPATVDMNATADFGINFAKGQIFGFLLNDGGAGINAVTVELKGEKFTRRVLSAVTGKFSFTGLSPGTYTVSTLAESFPPGYSLQNLAPQTIAVQAGQPASLQFVVRAIRSIAGKVQVYDKSLLQAVPLPGAVVRLKELSLEARTGANGAYIFRNLPAGDYTIAVEYEGKETLQRVTVPREPANIHDIDLSVGTK